MGKYNVDELDKMSGERTGIDRPKLQIPEIRFKGKEGGFKISTRPDNWQKGEPYLEDELGKAIKVTILRVKKFLSRDDLITDEYDGKNERIELKQMGTDAHGKWKVAFIDSGTPEELKTKHGLRANAMVYVLYEGQLMRLKVGGTSLFSDKYKDAVLLYNYASTFNRAEGERAYKFNTLITTYGPVKFPKGSIFLMSFERGEPLTEAQLDTVGDNLTIINDYYAQLAEYSAQFSERESVDTEEAVEPKEDLPTIQQEDEPPISAYKEEEVEDVPL